MNSIEHKKVGDAVSVKDRGNPYISKNGAMTTLTLMHLQNGIPHPIHDLKLTLGDIVAMPDYFTDPDWNLKVNLEPCNKYRSTEELGKALIRREVTEAEKMALLDALHDLANPKRKRSSVDTVLNISSATYFPVQSVNSLIQELMFFLRVKHYDKKLDRNKTHFTPWSIYVYNIGHTMALDYAETAYQLRQRAINPSFRADNPFFLKVLDYLGKKNQINHDFLLESAHRFHVMSLEVEMYTAHYLSDHFAAGHMSQVGDLRELFPDQDGVLGGIAVNTMHNELNQRGVLTTKPYDPEPNEADPPLEAYGDDYFERCRNTFNQQACINSLQQSVKDLESAFDDGTRPDSVDYGALCFLADVDINTRQPEPMFLIHNDKIFVRGNLRKIRILGPDDYDQVQKDPQSWGYKPVKGKLHLLYILFKLRLLPFYSAKEVPLTAEEEANVKRQEDARNPGREPMPTPDCALPVVTRAEEAAFFEKEGSPYLGRNRSVVNPGADSLLTNQTGFNI